MTFDVTTQSQVGRGLWARYGDSTKLANAEALEQAIAAGAECIETYPWRVVAETGNICNLTCCADRTGRSGLPRGFLRAADVERFLQPLWPYLVQVNLFNWGEPFLNRELPQIIATIHDHRVGTHVHTNMNHLPEGLAERVIDSGLDFLIASIDGVTQPVYETYRKGGSCQRALQNLKTFIDIRNQRRSDTPRVVWRFLCFPHTLHQIDAARRVAAEIGADDLALGEGGLNGYVYTEQGRKKIGDETVSAQPPYCRDVYDFPVIHWDGKLLPCCNACSAEFAWGDLTSQNFLDAFNTPPFRTARRLAWGADDPTSPCRTCPRIPHPATTSRDH